MSDDADTVKVVLSEEWDGHLYFAELVTDRRAGEVPAERDIPRAQWERWQKIERDFDAVQEEMAAIVERRS